MKKPQLYVAPGQAMVLVIVRQVAHKAQPDHDAGTHSTPKLQSLNPEHHHPYSDHKPEKKGASSFRKWENISPFFLPGCSTPETQPEISNLCTLNPKPGKPGATTSRSSAPPSSDTRPGAGPAFSGVRDSVGFRA